MNGAHNDKLVQVPVSLGVAGYEAVSLYKGKRVISSKGDEGSGFTVLQLVFYCFIGVLAGLVGGLLGLGGGFILGPVFLELGVPPQVCVLLNFDLWLFLIVFVCCYILRKKLAHLLD